MKRLLQLAFPFCSLAGATIAASLVAPAALAQDAAYQSFQTAQYVHPGQVGRIDPHAANGTLACPSLGVLVSVYNEENLAASNSTASVASAQIAAAQAGCMVLPASTSVQVLSFYPLRANTQNTGSGYLQILGSTTGGTKWIGAGAVLPLPNDNSAPPPSPFGIAPGAPPASNPLAPLPASQSLPLPNSPPASPAPAIPQNGAPTMALPPLPPASATPPPSGTPADQGYVPLPTLPEPSATPPAKNPSGACSDVNSLINATQNGHGCTQP